MSTVVEFGLEPVDPLVQHTPRHRFALVIGAAAAAATVLALGVPAVSSLTPSASVRTTPAGPCSNEAGRVAGVTCRTHAMRYRYAPPVPSTDGRRAEGDAAAPQWAHRPASTDEPGAASHP